MPRGQEFKKNSNHLTIKMRPGETLKRYLGYFQNQMALVYNCRDDVVVAAFIAGLQTDHSNKHLVKYVTNMKDIMSRAKKYIQLEEATQGSTSQTSQE